MPARRQAVDTALGSTRNLDEAGLGWLAVDDRGRVLGVRRCASRWHYVDLATWAATSRLTRLGVPIDPPCCSRLLHPLVVGSRLGRSPPIERAFASPAPLPVG
jgi:hypothetical protein